MKTVADFKKEIILKKGLKTKPLQTLEEISDQRLKVALEAILPDLVANITAKVLANRDQIISAVLAKIEPPESGHTPTEEELLAIIEPLIPTVENGKDYILTDEDKKQIASTIKVPVVEKVIVEKRTEVVKEKPIVKEVAVADEPEVTAKKLNTLKEAIKPEVIEGLKKLMTDIKANKKGGTKLFVRGGGGEVVKAYDISTLLDGVTKTFTIPSNRRVIDVKITYPAPLRHAIDYTYTTTSITFTAEIDAPTYLSSGQSVIIIYSE